MKDASKVQSSSRDEQRPKNNRQRLERLLRKMLYSELNGSFASGITASSPSVTPYRRVIE